MFEVYNNYLILGRREYFICTSSMDQVSEKDQYNRFDRVMFFVWCAQPHIFNVLAEI